MGGGFDVGPGCVDATMNCERRTIDRILSFDDFPGMVDQNQVRRFDLVKGNSERIDPEMIFALRVAYRDVTGDAF